MYPSTAPVQGGFAEHVVRRGIAQAPCFFAPGDRTAFLRLLGSRSGELECRVHAYALMGNHVHLLLTPGARQGVARLMRSLETDYRRHLRQTQGIETPVLEATFAASAIHTARHLIACMQYIELNPVRAGIVRRPGQFRWTSYLANACGSENSLLSPHPHYLALGRDPGERQGAYRRSVEAMLQRGSPHAASFAIKLELSNHKSRS